MKKDRECLFNTNYFISVYYNRLVCCCTRILKENEGTPDASRRFGIGKPMLIVPRFYHRHRSGAKIVAISGHLAVKNCTKIHLRSPIYLSWYGGGSQPPPQEPHRTSALWVPAHHLPSPGKKIPRAPMTCRVSCPRPNTAAWHCLRA